MKAIHRRVGKLECALLPQPGTWRDKQLWERIQAGRKRVAALHGERPFHTLERPRHLTSGQDIFDRLNEGRLRVHQEWLARRPVILKNATVSQQNKPTG